MQKACEIAPEAADAYYLLGRLYIQQGDKEKVKPALETAVELGHPDARAQLDDLK
jgi:Tfp pilus assembly protein FimV